MHRTLTKFNQIVTFIVILSAIIENVFFFDTKNFVASFVLIYGWLIIRYFVLTSINLRLFPVSFLMILGLSMFYYVLPMPLTLLEFKPVTFNLNVPYLTFWHHFLFVNVIVFTHKLYTLISKGKNIFRSVLLKTDFYVVPTNKLIWITALLGLFGSFYNYFIYDYWHKEVTDRNFLYYINSILAAYIWMPVIIPFVKFRYNKFVESKKSNKFIIIYSVFVFIVAIASNWRTVLFSGIVLFISMYSIGVLLEYYNLKRAITPKNLILIIALFFIVTGPLVDLGYTMLIVRGERYTLSTVDFLKKTIDVYNDKDMIDRVKKNGIGENGIKLNLNKWNEDYLHNVILNRFVNLKISDNCLFYAKKAGYQNPLMQKELVNQIKAFTPNVLLKSFDIKYSKKTESSSYSIGDYLYSIAIKDSSVRGSAIISSMPGVGMAFWGYWYLLVLIPMFLIIFSMFDSFVYIKNRSIVFSYFFFVMLTQIVNYFNDRHVYIFEFRFILRTYFETIIIFLIMMKVVRIIIRIFSKKTNNKLFITKPKLK